MSKFTAIVLTAAICLPVGAFAKDMMLKGHPHLQKAHTALNEADAEISASQQANEAIWKDEGGHGQKAKEAISAAKAQLDDAANWVNNHK